MSLSEPWSSEHFEITAHDPPTVVQMFSVHYAFDNLVSSLTGVMQVYCTSNLEAASKVDTDLKGIEAAANEWDAILAKYLAAAEPERQLLWAEVFSELGLLEDVKGRNK